MKALSLFEVFGVSPEAFSRSSLRNTYYRLIKQVHPDTPSDIPAEAKSEISSFLGSAYAKLKDDYARSVYAYTLNNQKGSLTPRPLPFAERVFTSGITAGIDKAKNTEKKSPPFTVLDTPRSSGPCGKGVIDALFLDRILGLEERIQHAEPPELARIESELSKEVEICKQNSTKLNYLLQWRYYNRLLDATKAKRRDAASDFSG